jgi:hypothetical protein
LPIKKGAEVNICKVAIKAGTRLNINAFTLLFIGMKKTSVSDMQTKILSY